jgi:hypothetical protein
VEHLDTQLGAVSIDLDDEVLDEIDRIVPPGVTLNPHDEGWQHPEPADAALRRRYGT